jgi:magnesium transporter
MRIISHFIEKAESKGLRGIKSGRDLFLYILENFIDLCSDVLEKNHLELEGLSNVIFDQGHKRKDYKASLKTIAAIGDLNSKVRETLVSLNRTLAFWGGVCESQEALREVSIRIKSMTADVAGLLDHAGFVSQKITFLLDATLGFVNLEQNGIIKIFSVAAVIFLPPTLVASIYGMNFKYIPETEWIYGYPMALLVMLFSAILPYLYFKFKNWL